MAQILSERPFKRLIERVIFSGDARALRVVAPWSYRAIAANRGAAKNISKMSARIFDLIYLLRRHRPRSIVELGSGFTTAAFARYARRAGATFISIDENPDWVNSATLPALSEAGINDFFPLIAERKESEAGRWYDTTIPADTDFLYVDGPSSRNKTVASFACLDALNTLDAGATPNLIVFDGRTPTILTVLQSKHGERYSWSFQEKFRHQSGLDVPVRLGHHTVAKRR